VLRPELRKNLLMNLKKFVPILGTGLLVVCTWVFTGCGSMPASSGGPIAPSNVDASVNTSANTNRMAPLITREGGDFLRPGQKVTIEFNDIPGNSGAISQTIQENGMINLPLGVTVKAAGLNRGELIEIIHDKYVPAYYKRMTVNVKSDELYFSVGGEVKNPSQRLYVGQTTVLQAIQSAGDFTDFAQKKKILVTRANGQKYTVNGLKAAQDRSLDIPVYPGDRIIVPRRLF